MPRNSFPFDKDIDKNAISELKEIWKTAEQLPPPFLDIDVEALPEMVDLSKHLYYIRKQYGGCWGYATLAVWDIMNEIVCPYSPNLSFRFWRTFHSRPELSKEYKGVWGIFSPDGRFHTNTKGAGWLEWGNPSFFKVLDAPQKEPSQLYMVILVYGRKVDGRVKESMKPITIV